MELPFEVPAGLTFEPGVSVASWVDERLLPWRGSGEGVLVGELVPTGFEAYARILHPARRRTAEGGLGEPVTWEAVARARGGSFHPEVQFPALIGAPLDHRVSETDEFWMPEEGSIPAELCAPLTDVLGRHTTAADRCLFCLWDGFGFLGGGSSYTLVAHSGVRGRMQRRAMRRAARRRSRRFAVTMASIPRVQIRPSPDRRGAFREYLLFRGPLTALTTSFIFEPVGYFQSPNIWWPEDRAWVVCTEIDDWTTYVGGSRACVGDLLADSDLEVVETRTDLRWDVAGDRANARPDRL